MKKKIGFLGVILLAVLAFSGCGKKEATLSEQEGALIPKEAQTEQEADSIIGSVRDAMALGSEMKCTYTLEQEDGTAIESEVFVSGKKYKTVSEINGQKMYALFDGEAVYTWTEGQKQGMKIREDCYADFQSVDSEQQTAENEEAETPEDAFNNAFNVHCEKSGGEDFSLPEEVEFADQCELLKTQMQQMEKLKESLPAGFELPEGVEMPQ